MKISIEEAISRLRSNEVVAVPTETVYGLAACPDSDVAVSAVFTLKKRPQDNPLIVHIADQEDISRFSSATPPQALLSRFWPGPLTLVLPAIKDAVSSRVRAGLSTVALRVPAHQDTLSILRATGPLVAPSANISGRPSATTAEEVEEDFGSAIGVVDGGKTVLGIESTIIGYFDGNWCLLRAGMILPEELASVFGYIPAPYRGENIVSPGRHHRHYSPRATLQVGGFPPSDAAILGFENRLYPTGNVVILGPVTSPSLLLHHFYSSLRKTDRLGYTKVWIDTDFPEGGLFTLLRDRIYRAAGKTL
ncbi:MAG: threonylcarbamoyl-AMP synthase [Chlamydiae bacterium RIFCSPHIGHO2_12_FULL_49_11]|nr:MAG: threonylcarbamoyl-AMP synthase [Chlamydiae bacterium RIFCSPHIGHO2_12_FULL_49_11]